VVSTTRETRIAETFVGLADTLVDDFDVIDVLHALAERCVELLDVAAAGLMLADLRGGLHTVAASDEQARLLELFEIQNEEGPCLDCYRGGQPLENIELRAAGERWPGFVPRALAGGFTNSSALPLRLRADVIGALNLFHVGPLDPADLRLGRALADAATISILAYRAIRHGEVVGAQLQTALDSRVVIEQAKGILAERWQIGMDEAFQRLRAHARSHNRLLLDVARDVVNGDAGVTSLLDVASGGGAGGPARPGGSAAPPAGAGGLSGTPSGRDA
jgi:hypothetical protein